MHPTENPFKHLSKPSVSQKAGLEYEKQLKDHLQKVFGAKCRTGTWWKYTTESSAKVAYCEIDAYVILEKEKKIIAIECKLKHTMDAYEQLELLYVPILKYHYGPRYSYASVEVCRLYDPTTGNAFPHSFIEDIKEADPKNFSVMLWQK